MRRSSTQRIADIRDAIRRIRSYVGELEGASIGEDVVADAVVYNLLVIGEAVKGLGDELRDAHPEIPWADIAEMRDLLAHEYFRVDRAIVERTLQRDLAQLERALAPPGE